MEEGEHDSTSTNSYDDGEELEDNATRMVDRSCEQNVDISATSDVSLTIMTSMYYTFTMYMYV